MAMLKGVLSGGFTVFVLLRLVIASDNGLAITPQMGWGEGKPTPNSSPDELPRLRVATSANGSALSRTRQLERLRQRRLGRPAPLAGEAYRFPWPPRSRIRVRRAG